MSREQLDPIDVPPEHIGNRRPSCEWLMVWTYGFDDLAVSHLIKRDVQQYYPELQEVYNATSSKVSEGNSTGSSVRGYIFLKVCQPTFGFREALLRVEGVGGIVGSEVEKILHNVQPLRHVWAGDLIRVTSGPLQNTLGRVEEIRGSEEVKVVLDLLGRTLSLPFKLTEVQSVGRVSL